MRVKLIQSEVIGSADCIQHLDFSALAGHDDWSVAADFGKGDEIIAEVIWTGSAAYAMWTEFKGERGNHKTVSCHSYVVPAIICRLVELFRLERISGKRCPQPIVRVTPIDT